MIAALFVETGGCYFGLPDVDPWDKARDARLYAGPHPVAAHPPCERWGRFWHGACATAGKRFTKGDDDGCFAAAIAAVRKFGGVLEHPAGSSAWRAFGLTHPPRSGGWVLADPFGWTCCVDQGNYGHRAAKATWLYACRIGALPSLKWERSSASHKVERMWKGERSRTPVRFRDDVMLWIARSAARAREAA